MGDKVDVVIIGGGIAGLCTGLYLQKMGKRSIILEHGNQVGGNMSGIWRKGFYFDCGDQSTEEVGVLFTILKELGVYDPDDWTRARFRYVTPDCDVMMYDYDQMREDYKKTFPGSRAQLDKWFDFIKPQCESMREMMGQGAFNLVLDGREKARANLRMLINSASMGTMGMKMMSMTGEEKALECFPDEPRLSYLFGVGGAQNMLLMMHLTFWYTYVQDYWYPCAGLQGFMSKLADAYRERGGEIRLKSTVDKVITSGPWVTGVETAQGDRFRGEHYVNTGNPKRLINEMLDDNRMWPYRDRQITTAAPVSVSICSAFLGLDMDAQELKKHVKDHHTLYWRTYETKALDMYDPEAHNKGWAMISAPSLHLPHLAPKGKSSLNVQVFTSYHWQNGWATGTDDPFARTPQYRRLKKKVLDDIIRETEYIIPGLSEKIVYREMATPRSFSRWTLNPEGSIMGWTYDSLKSHMARKFARFRTPYKNLFMAGQYATWPSGVVFSAMSGRIVSKGIYGGFWRQLLY
jgi:phytoene dehydrogenase-like protein